MTSSPLFLRRLLHASALYLLAAAAQAQWSPGADFSGARFDHTATPLPGGGVLVAGGSDGADLLVSTLRQDADTGQWTAAAPLPEPRTGHTGTLLRNGTVLIAGGTAAGGGPLGSALTYDPQDNTFTPTANAQGVRRRLHTATVLQDGRVLVAGGQGIAGQAALRSAEIYDPASRTWYGTDQMPGSGARGHTATLLPDGRVLVVGGIDNHENATTAAALWNPADGTWTAAAALPAGQQRLLHSATLLPSGLVYVAGGEDTAGTPLSSAWLYNPATNTWGAAAQRQERTRHSATLLPDGRVLLAGGTLASSGGPPRISSEYYNPGDNSSSLAFNLGQARTSHSATLLPSGQVLVAGGMGTAAALASTERFTPAPSLTINNAATRAASANFIATVLADGSVLVAGGSYYGSGGSAAPMRYRPGLNDWVGAGTNAVAYRRLHTQTLLQDGRVLVAGGYGANTPHTGAEVFTPATNAWSATPAMAQARSYHTATLLPGGDVLVAGGETEINNDSGLTHAEIYRPALDRWLGTAPMPLPRSRHTATPLPDGRVMVVGGASSGQVLASMAFYDPARATWAAGTASLNQARYYHTATLLRDGRVLVVGGWGDTGARLDSAEIYDPATNLWTSTATLGQPRDSHTATLLPDGRVMVMGGTTFNASNRIELLDPASRTWTTDTSTLPQQRQSHAAVLLASGKVLVIGGYFPDGNNADQPILIDPRPTTRQRPVITNNFTLQDAGAPLQLIGTGFTGDSEASSGGGRQSASNAPLVQLERLDGGPVLWLAALMSSDNGYTSRPLPTGLSAGMYRARVFSNAIASNAYTFELRAAVAAPGAPRNVTATPGNAQVTIAWQHPAGGATPASYTVTAEPGGMSCTVQYPATSCTVTGLANGTAYTFTVTADAEGGSASAPPTDDVMPTAGPGPDPGPVGVQPVPTLSEWGVLLLTTLTLLAAGLRRRMGDS